MNKTEELRERIARLVFSECFPEYDLLTLEPYLEIADQILLACKEEGLKFVVYHAQLDLAPDIEVIEIEEKPRG